MQVLTMSDAEILASGNFLFSDAAAELIQKDRRTLYRWHKNGKLIALFITPSGKRVYHRSQLEHLIPRQRRAN